jgi:hypothetical protein
MDGGLSTEYWATLAQVMPVVAVAILLEARAQMSRWGEDELPGWAQVTSGVMWSVTLVLLTLGEVVAIDGVRGDPPGAFWSGLCETAITAGLSVIILTPAIYLLFAANAEGIAAMVAFRPLVRLKLRRMEQWLDRRHRLVMSGFASTESDLDEMAAKVTAWGADLEQQRDRLTRAQLADAEAELRAAQGMTDESRVKIAQLRTEHVARHEQYVRKLAQLRRDFRRANRELRPVIVAQLRRTAVNVLKDEARDVRALNEAAEVRAKTAFDATQE